MAAIPFTLEIMIGLAAVREQNEEQARFTSLVRDEDNRKITVHLPGTLTVEQVDAVVPLLNQVFDQGQVVERRRHVVAPVISEPSPRPFFLAESEIDHR